MCTHDPDYFRRVAEAEAAVRAKKEPSYNCKLDRIIELLEAVLKLMVLSK